MRIRIATNVKKLTPKMVELLKAMRDGQRVYYAPYMGRFNPRAYYRCQAVGQCTKQVEALLARGLIRKANQERYSGRHDVELTDAGRESDIDSHG